MTTFTLLLKAYFYPLILWFVSLVLGGMIAGNTVSGASKAMSFIAVVTLAAFVVGAIKISRVLDWWWTAGYVALSLLTIIPLAFLVMIIFQR